jgi:serine/threonine protein kinase
MTAFVIANRYELGRAIGQGGMGEVFEAIDRQTRRRVAVKRLSITTGVLAAEAAARFRRELLATAQLATRHVVGVHDGGVDDGGVAYMVMDLLVGEDLEHILEHRQTLPRDLALRLVSQACDGLVVAHAHGIVHRDIKPSNLFVCEPNDRGTRIVKLLDFGIARLESETLATGLTELTRTGALVGSPLYMAPEQLRGVKQLDHRADLWSLGVVLYRALTGSLPHAAETIGDLIVQVCSVPAAPLHERVPEIPPELSALVGRLLAIDPAARLASATELASELARWLPAGNDIEQAMFDAPSPAPSPARSTAQRPLAMAQSPSMIDRGEPRIPVLPVARTVPTTYQSLPPQRSVTKVLVLLVLIAVLVVVGERAWREYRRSREVPLPVLGAPPDLMSGMPADLAATEGAVWFAKVRGHCNSASLRSTLTGLPPPDNDSGLAFAAACAAVAGDLNLAREKIAATDDPKYASWPTFAVAHPLADQRNDDPAVANIMRLVLEFWPENFLANYHAGITEFIQRDNRAAQHLGAVIQYYPTEDDFKATARTLLQELVSPGPSNCDRVVVIDPEGNRIHPSGCAP